MARDIKVKICGLKSAADVDAAVDAGASYLGLNFFPKSPRSVSTGEAASLAVTIPPGVAKVGLVVNEDNDVLDRITADVPLDFLQLHGSESVERVAEIKERYGLPVIKAVGVADAADLEALTEFGRVADQLLVDAKPPKSAVLPGGNGLTFDWRLIAGRRWPVPWMLAGGLTADNVADAIRLTGAAQVDVSSGVETEPGVKDRDLIRAFIAACK